MEELDATVSNLKAISAKVNGGSGTVGALVNDRTLYNNVTAGATAFQEDMEASNTTSSCAASSKNADTRAGLI